MAGAKLQHFPQHSKLHIISSISAVWQIGMLFVKAQFRLQISYLPSVFTLDLFENGDVRNGRKEQNTGTEFDGVRPKDFVS